MKKTILGFLIPLLCIVAIIICLKLNLPSDSSDSLDKLSDNDLGNTSVNTVDIIDNHVNDEINYNGINIKDISIYQDDDKIYLDMSILGEEANINGKKLTIVLLNPYADSSANEKTIVLNSESSYLLLDITNIYNDPNKIKFIFE